MPNLTKFLKIKLLTIYMFRLLNPLTCDLHNFVKIHFQIKPPSANHLHYQQSFHPELHFGGIWGAQKTGWSIQANSGQQTYSTSIGKIGRGQLTTMRQGWGVVSRGRCGCWGGGPHEKSLRHQRYLLLWHKIPLSGTECYLFLRKPPR
jgi:hypothetical protein